MLSLAATLFGSFLLVSCSSAAEIQERSLSSWLDPHEYSIVQTVFGKTIKNLYDECFNVDLALPYADCHVDRHGKGCEDFCRQQIVMDDLTHCTLRKAAAKRGSPQGGIDELKAAVEDQREITKIVAETFGKMCGNFHLAPSTKTVLAATQEAFARCVVKGSSALGAFYYRHLWLPNMCANGGTDSAPGHWILRCIRINSLIAVAGSDAEDQIKEIRQKFGPEKEDEVLRNVCTLYGSLAAMSIEQLKTFLTGVAGQLKDAIVNSKWNVIGYGHVVPVTNDNDPAADAIVQNAIGALEAAAPKATVESGRQKRFFILDDILLGILLYGPFVIAFVAALPIISVGAILSLTVVGGSLLIMSPVLIVIVPLFMLVLICTLVPAMLIMG